MWELLGREPQIVYHFTRRKNVDSIVKDRQLKKFKDTHVFVCENYEGCIEVIKSTILNPNARYVDFDGMVKKYNPEDIKDFVIMKLETRFSKTMNWYKSQSAFNKMVDDYTVAYKGNLPIKVLEVQEINI